MPGWGQQQWGIDAWGGVGASLTITKAVAVDTHTVRVTLSREPKHDSRAAAGDATNPATWTVSRLDTGALHTVLGVELAAAPLGWDVFVLEAFAGHLVTHRIQSTTLQALNGVPISAPNSAGFLGVLSISASAQDGNLADRGLRAVDLANPPGATETNVGGTLQVVGGDYASVAGTQLLKKLIYRRLFTRKRGFFHLPNYGLGLKVKEPLPAADVVLLRKLIERDVALEPEVESVRVEVEFLEAENAVVIRLQVRERATGAEHHFRFPDEAPAAMF